jgi:diguanylate cyclase (GGDEF)-like protein
MTLYRLHGILLARHRDISGMSCTKVIGEGIPWPGRSDAPRWTVRNASGLVLGLASTLVGVSNFGLTTATLLVIVVVDRTASTVRHRFALTQAWQLAQTDELTGLANRRALLSHLSSETIKGREFGLLLVDLNGFKNINDRYGHHVGDQVLSDVGRRLAAAQDWGCLVARLGGDEFVITVPGGDRDILRQRGDWVRFVLSRPVRAGAAEVRVTASIGASKRVSSDTASDALLVRADNNMYDDKKTYYACGGKAGPSVNPFVEPVSPPVEEEW